MKLQPLPKGAIVTGCWQGVVPISGLTHPGCLWLLTSRGTRSDVETGYVQDVRCLRHGTNISDVEGSFLRERAEKVEIDRLLVTMKDDHKRLHANLKVLQAISRFSGKN